MNNEELEKAIEETIKDLALFLSDYMKKELPKFIFEIEGNNNENSK